MQKSQSGFTLVELIVVIVLLGILGVTALGKFQDLSGDAEQAALEGVAAEISASSSINYAKSLLGDPILCVGDGATATGTSPTCVPVDTATEGCDVTELGNLLTGDVIPNVNGVAVTATANATAANCNNGAGDVYSCTLTSNTGITATVSMICTE